MARGLQKNILVFLLLALAIAALLETIPILGTVNVTVLFGNEGWSAYHQARAAAGQSPYPLFPSMVYNNYPPLSFYLVGAVGKLVGDNIFAGRALSVAGFFVTALGVAGAARAMGCARLPSLFAMLLFMVACLYDHGDIGTNDPQFVGHALQLAGLIAILRQPRSVPSLFIAACLFVLGFFIKANLVALPLAGTLWLALVERRGGIILALSGAGLTLIGSLLFQTICGPSLWSVLDAPRIWILQYSLQALAGRLPALILPLAVSLLLLRRFSQNRALQFCLLYFAIALASAAYFLGGAGTGGNMLFDATIALSLCGGLGVHLLATAAGRRNLFLPFAACHVLPLAGIVIFTLATDRFPRYWHEPDAAPVLAARRDVDFLKARTGPALCKSLTLCFWAGKQEEVDLWGYEQAVTLHQRDGHELRDAIRQQRYRVLELGAPPDALAAWPEVDPAYASDIARAIEANYRIDHSDVYGTFWVRRS